MAKDPKSNAVWRVPKEIEKRYPKLKAVNKNLETTAVLNMLTRDPQGFTYDRHKRQREALDYGALIDRISGRTATNINDNASMMEQLPDLRLAEKILVSSILSPKDMLTTEINWGVKDSFMGTELSQHMLDVVQGYFEGPYRIKSMLPEALRHILFSKGSYPLMVVPVNAIDEIVNSTSRVSTESMKEVFQENKLPRPTGLLGPGLTGTVSNKDSVATEHMLSISNEDYRRAGHTHGKTQFSAAVGQFENTRLLVTDNPSVLKYPLVERKLISTRVGSILGNHALGLENMRMPKINIKVNGEVTAVIDVREEIEKQKKLETPDLSQAPQMSETEEAKFVNTLFRPRPPMATPVDHVKTQDKLEKENVGSPITLLLPPEALIPVHVPSNPKEHIAYYLVLDETGNPVRRAEEADLYSKLATSHSISQDMNSYLLEAVGVNSKGRGDYSSRLDYMQASKLYASSVEADLIERLKNGVYGKNVELANVEEVYRLMFSRALASKTTQLLFVPAELVTYMAFNYNEYGVGVSLLEQTKILGSIRSMLLFSNTMAAIKNSVGRVHMNIELDPRDPDPSGTVEFLRYEYAKTRSGQYPIGVSNPVDIIHYLQNAAVDLQVSGNTGYPETKVNLEDYASSKTPVDADLEENMRDRHIYGLGLDPEMIEVAKRAEFATSIVNSNILLSKTVMVYQDQFCPFLEDMVRKHVFNDANLINELKKVLTNNADKMELALKNVDRAERERLTPEVVIYWFLESLEITLPRPDNVRIENQKVAFEAYKDFLESVFEVIISSEMFTREFEGEVEQYIPAAITALKNTYLRNWLRDNNVMPELWDMVTKITETRPAINLNETHSHHVEGLALTIEDFLKNRAKAQKARNERLQALQEENDLEEGGGGGSVDDSGGDDDTGGDGGDEFDDGMDLDEGDAGGEEEGKDKESDEGDKGETEEGNEPAADEPASDKGEGEFDDGMGEVE